MKVLITGSTGFVGRNLSPYLTAKGTEVLLPGRDELKQELPAHDIVIHLAGKAHDLRKNPNPEEYLQVNYELTKQLYNTFLKSDASVFIFISSVKAAADSVNEPLTEDHVPNPKTDYGLSKLKAENYIQSQALPAGKSYFILRPCMIHGPGNKGNLNLLYKIIAKGIPYPLGSFENQRSFLSIENLCFVIHELTYRRDISSGIYHLADDETLSTNELIRLIASGTTKKPHIWRIPSSIVRIVAKLGDFMHLPLNTERLTKLTESYVVDNSKIKSVLGKQFPVETKSGISKTIRSFHG